jgi:hypothetical protein
MVDEATFAQQQVTEETLSESDKIRQRIADYKAQITPNSLSVIEVMLQQQLSSGLIKPGDLDALMILRDDVNKASIDYRTQLENAQRRLTDLAQDEAIEKAQAEEAKIASIVDSRDTERQRRKDAEGRLAQVEAVLASHGISMDLNQDGHIGLAEGQVADELTVEEQQQVDNIVSVEKDNIAEAPVEPIDRRDRDYDDVQPKKPSHAFSLARAMNPGQSESEIMQDELEPIQNVSDEMMSVAHELASDYETEDPTPPSIGNAPQSETHYDLFEDTHAWADREDSERKSFQEWNEEQGELELTVPEDAKGTKEFFKEVEQVERSSTRQEIADGVYIEEREVSEPTPTSSAPIISASQLPGDETEHFKSPVDTNSYSTTEHDESDDLEDAKRVVIKDVKIIPEIPEEEYDEVTIPSESDLKAMTKSSIHEQANVLDFDVPKSLTKVKMIKSFLQQTEEFVSKLQESGEFVSATSSDANDDTDNNQDGGYF